MKLYKSFISIIAISLLAFFNHAVFGSSSIVTRNKTALNLSSFGTESLTWHPENEMVHFFDTSKAESEMVFDFKKKCYYPSAQTNDSKITTPQQNPHPHSSAPAHQCNAPKAATTQTVKTDADALQYCQTHENSFIAIVWPLAQGKETEIVEAFNRFGKIYYQKTMLIPETEIFKLVDIAHNSYFCDGVPFLCDNQADKIAQFVKEHKQKYVPSKDAAQQASRIFVLAFNDEKTATACKKAIRTLFNIGFYSIHINDTHDETLELAEHLFKRDEAITLT